MWLVFEVEGGVQIRPEQYQIARHVIDNPGLIDNLTIGAISQLNMGKGKTRIILPMLILHFGSIDDGCLVRVNFLNQLFREATDFLLLTLTASTLNVTVVATNDEQCERELQQ